MDLEVHLEDGALLAGELIELIRHRGAVGGAGEAMRGLSACYRALGIYDYLINFDTEALLHGLIQSALTRRHYLQQSDSDRAAEAPWRRGSLCGPFFDALVASQTGLAREIASLSPSANVNGFEYEDDYLYARILYDSVIDGPTVRSETEAALERFGAVLEGQPSPRFDLCAALLERDDGAFAEAFEELLTQHVQEMTELADPQLGHSAAQAWDFEANRRFFVEGAAVLRIGELAGFEAKDDYVLCPRIAVPPGYRFTPASFPMVPL